MDFNQKLKAALDLLASAGVSRSLSAPPNYGLLWWLRVPVPPPHFSGFGFNFAFSAVCFIVTCALINGVAVLLQAAGWIAIDSDAPPWQGLVVIIGSACLLGLALAAYYRRSARRNAIPHWQQFRPQPHGKRSPADG
ncbi:DUF6404 family protein [Variovorax terrae]|uniref:DUF6404 family protein n=1 Tax=Variovorax terrae TaxID=2923278 RepID=A0A9X1W0Q9_9BURK|nr:DUF6404 family protein [Variovorax terrae]MCJ0763973.1 DUF6404 family protein [Variovorax terrae]